ncbi:unnamed protein product, partial [Allacma fusca]
MGGGLIMEEKNPKRTELDYKNQIHVLLGVLVQPECTAEQAHKYSNYLPSVCIICGRQEVDLRAKSRDICGGGAQKH